jgi:hypothetical protein
MSDRNFIEDYLKPSEDHLDRNFTHPLPPIPGLEKGSEFIVQGKLKDTFSTNIIHKYVSESTGISLIDVYKCSQHAKDGQFVRLVGTMRVVKSGFPALFLDAAVTNINPFTQQREEVTTRVLIHLPQASNKQREIIVGKLNEMADKDSVTHKEVPIPHMPEYWGNIWLAESKKLDMELIEKIRNIVGESYVTISKETDKDETIDYTPVKNQMAFTTSKKEHELFKKMGLTVDLEAQAGFFSVMTAGMENP